jgi:phosphate/sulfate permease
MNDPLISFKNMIDKLVIFLSAVAILTGLLYYGKDIIEWLVKKITEMIKEKE